MIGGVDPVDIMLFLFIGMLFVLSIFAVIMYLMYKNLKGINDASKKSAQDSGELYKISDRLFRVHLSLDRWNDRTVEIPNYILRAAGELYRIRTQQATERIGVIDPMAPTEAMQPVRPE